MFRFNLLLFLSQIVTLSSNLPPKKLIKAVSSALGLNICVLNLSNSRLNDQSLNEILLDAPPQSIILLEVNFFFKKEWNEKDLNLSLIVVK